MKKQSVFIIDDRREVFVNGKEITLAPKEFDILALLKRKNTLLSRTAIVKEIWTGSRRAANYGRTVDQHIARLRRKIGADLVKTVARYGYKYVGA